MTEQQDHAVNRRFGAVARAIGEGTGGGGDLTRGGTGVGARRGRQDMPERPREGAGAGRRGRRCRGDARERGRRG